MSQPWLSASSAERQDAALAEHLVSIPPRGCGQTSGHRESWTMAQALSVQPDLFGTTFPATFRHQDKPDFAIVRPDIRIGVEIVEAIPQALAYAYAVQNSMPD